MLAQNICVYQSLQEILMWAKVGDPPTRVAGFSRTHTICKPVLCHRPLVLCVRPAWPGLQVSSRSFYFFSSISYPCHWTLTEATLIASSSKFWGEGMRKTPNTRGPIFSPGTILLKSGITGKSILWVPCPLKRNFYNLILKRGLQMFSKLARLRRPGKYSFLKQSKARQN